jgi:hypothetical protein
MTFQGRVMTIAATLFISLGCLIGAAVVHRNARQLATATPVEATIAKLWTERGKSKSGEPAYYAQLIFDRKDNGGVVHCDVPRVLVGQSAPIGMTVEVFPHAASCQEPYVMCEGCAKPSDSLELAILIIAIVSGLICAIQIRKTVQKTTAA